MRLLPEYSVGDDEYSAVNGDNDNLLANGVVMHGDPIPEENGLANGHHITEASTLANGLTDYINLLESEGLLPNNGDHLGQDVEAVSTAVSYNAIDLAMASPLQTYQQFLDCFTHLTTGDIPQGLTLASAQSSSAAREHLSSTTYILDLLPVDISLPDASDINLPEVRFAESADSTCFEPATSDDPIEELLLTDTLSCQPRPDSLGYRIKVDNFVDDDGVDEVYTVAEAEAANNELGFMPPAYAISDSSFIQKAQIPNTSELFTKTVEPVVTNIDTNDDNDDVLYDLPESAAQFECAAESPVTQTLSSVDKISHDVTHEAVEPFSLDVNFDYDSVTLAVKYSAEDLGTLNAYQTVSHN